MKRENASSQPLTQGLTSDKWFGSIVTALVLTVTVKRDTVTHIGSTVGSRCWSRSSVMAIDLELHWKAEPVAVVWGREVAGAGRAGV